MRKERIKNVYKATPMQAGMLFHALLDEKSDAYFEQGVFSIKGTLDKSTVEAAFNKLIDRYDILRTVFHYKNLKEPLQVVLNQRHFKLHFEDVSHLSQQEKKHYLEEMKSKDRQRGFDLEKDILMRAALVKTAEKEYQLIWSFHHILMDGWCLSIVFKDFIQIYQSLRQERPLSLPPVTPYFNYIRWLERQDKEKGLRYWQTYLEGYEALATLPRYKTQIPAEGYQLEEYKLIINEELTRGMNDVANQSEATLHMVCQTVWGILLQRYNNIDDVVFGSVVSGRPPEIDGIEHMIGLFINTVPIRICLENGTTFSRLLVQVKQKTASAKKHEFLPLAEIQANSWLKRQLLDHIMVFENYPIDKEIKNISGERETGFKIGGMDFYEHTNYDFNILAALGRCLQVKFSFNALVYELDFIEKIARHFEQVVKEVVNNPGIDVREISIVPEEEKQWILYDFNQTRCEYPREKTIQQLFEEQVERIPDRIALVGVHEIHEAHPKNYNRSNISYMSRISYKELHERSNRLAYLLKEKNVKPGTIVALMVERSIEMMVGILGILKAGGAYLPIDPNYPQERIDFMLKDSSVEILLATHNLSNKITSEKEILCLPDAINCVPTPSHLHLSPAPVTSLAYVIYTSGSTGKPKGVMIEHGALVNRLNWMQKEYPIGHRDTLLQKTPFTFDVSVWELLWWAVVGSRMCFLIPGGEKDPECIINTIEKNNITVIHFVPSMLSAFLEYIKSRNAQRKLCGLKQVIASGEALTVSQVGRFNDLLHRPNGTRLANLYGPTEAAIDVSFFDCSGGESSEIIPIGKPIDNIRLYVLDKYLHLQPIGIAGELCIAGDGLARGYINQAGLTAENFLATDEHGRTRTSFNKKFLRGVTGGSFFKKRPPCRRRQKIYKTGDLARWLWDGNIEFLGRIDHQVKIRGFRIEPEEIENHLLAHEGIKEAVVVVKEASAAIGTRGSDGSDTQYLCAYIVSHDELSVPQLKEYLAGQLPHYMIPSYFVFLEGIPLTGSGKIDRKALPFPGVEAAPGEYAAPRNETEEKLAEIWADVLRIDQNKISVRAGFFELGGNSINIMRIASEVNKTFELEISFNIFMKLDTIAQLALYISENKDIAQTIKYPAISPDWQHLHLPFPITDIQMAYLMGRSSQIEMGGVSTHIYWEFSSELDIQRLNGALHKIIRRHPMMRAVIQEDGQQRILKDITGWEIDVEDLSHLGVEQQNESIAKQRAQMSHHIFNPHQWPLFEIKAFKIRGNIYHFCVEFDPLIADAFSMMILFQEIADFYRDPQLELPALEISFRDYMMAYQELKDSGIYQRDKEYWLTQLDDFPSAPMLPLKCSPADIKIPHFKVLRKRFSRAAWRKLKQIAQKNNITPSVLLCTAYAEVMAYWSNQPALAINLTVFNRYPFHKDVDKIVGDFTSLVLLGIRLDPGASFWEKARGVQERLLEGLDHRHYDGVEFIREIARHNNLVGKAVMPIVFTSALFEQEEGLGEEPREETLDDQGDQEESNLNLQTSQVFLDCGANDSGGYLNLTWSYVNELFEEEVMGFMFRQYTRMLDLLAEGKTGYQFQLPQEQETLLESYNRTHQEIKPTTLHQLFQDQVELTPRNIALEHGERSITYKELDELSNRVAWYLREQGVGPNDCVGVVTPRCFDTISNVMGILKAGGAYVPIDPAYPEERRDYILNNSHCKLLIDERLSRTVDLGSYPGCEPDNRNQPGDIAYVIYTSGSTGKPKGVVISHQSAANTICDINQRFGVNETDRIIGISSMCFDLSVYDVFGALSTGAAQVLVEDQRDVNLLIDIMEKHEITIWNSVPAIMNMAVSQLEEDLQPGEINREPRLDEHSQEVFYWSPGVCWKPEQGGIQVGDRIYRGIAPKLFPTLYFITQGGIPLNKIAHEFPGVPIEELKACIAQLIQNKVLINGVMSPPDLFRSQENLFHNEYSDEILYDPVEYQKFKKKQLTRSYPQHYPEEIKLENRDNLPAVITRRRSLRKFAEEKSISSHDFSLLLSVFRQTVEEGEIRYYYASAGGLYPIDLYIYIKKNRVENIDEGLYYYNPMNHSLNLVNKGKVITKEVHFAGNKPIFASSAVSIFMIYNAETTMPKYGGMGYFMAAIDAGIMVSSLTHVGELLGIGLCSIGSMDFERVRKYFNINKNQVFLHAIELGLKPDLALEKAGHTGEFVNFENHKSGSYTGKEKLRLVLLSGDWIPVALPGQIKHHFPGAEVISLGGATEGSIWSIYYPVTRVNPEWKSIPYGYPLANQQFYVLNYNLVPCPIGVEGELFIGGIGVAMAYINNEEKTRYSFIRHPRFGRLYRTGDYGCFHKDGYIEFRGRKDHQVKIKGYRVELGEIENCLLDHEDVKGAVIVDRKNAANITYLTAYIVTGAEPSASRLKEYLAEKLPAYMIPQHFVFLEKIPLTPNGKVNRKELPEPTLRETADKDRNAAPVTHVERALAEIWQTILKIEEPGINDDFLELGGDSLKATTLVAKIHSRLNVKVPLAEVFRNPTIKELANYIKGTGEDKYASIEAVENKEYYPLASAQKRLYVLQQQLLHSEDTTYNITDVVMLEGILDGRRLTASFNQLVKRHENFRTSFEIIHQEVVQRIHDSVDFALEYFQLEDGREVREIVGEFVRVFDLSQAPLLRAGVIELGGERRVLMVDMHHIIADATSHGILIKEFMQFYKGETLPGLSLQYKDYSQWQNSNEKKDILKKQESFWLKELEDGIPVLNLPLDYERPAVRSFAGSALGFEIGRELTNALKELVLEEESTLYMGLLSLTYVLLAKICNQEEILVGTTVSGRNHADLRHIIGMFSNTLVLKNFPAGEKTFSQFLKEVKRRSLEAFENQDYPFEDLVEKTDTRKETTWNPLFDVIFAFQNMEKYTLEIPGLTVKPYGSENQTAKFDLTVQATEFNDRVAVRIEYCTKLFKQETIEQFINYFQEILAAVIKNKEIKLKDIKVSHDLYDRSIDNPSIDFGF